MNNAPDKKTCTQSGENSALGRKETPACNTGSHSPADAKSPHNGGSNGAIKAVVSLDWIAFVVSLETFEKAKPQGHLDPGKHIENFMEMLHLPIEYYEESEKGRLGWKRCFELDGMGGAFVALGGQDGTVYVQLSAEALKYYSALGWDVQVWARYMLNDLGARCRRLDIAFDDRGGYLHYDHIVAAVTGRNVVSRYRNKFDPGRGGSLSGDDGWTLYFGRYGGKTFVRIYDKAKERGLTDGTHWIRVEAVFRAERAELALVDWLKTGFSAARAVGLLRGLVDFRVRQEDNTIHPERWPFVDWWQAFLGEITATHLGTAAEPPKSVADGYEHLLKTASPLLAMVNDFYGEQAVADLIAAGRDRQKKQHKKAVEISKREGDTYEGVMLPPPQQVPGGGLALLRQSLQNRGLQR